MNSKHKKISAISIARRIIQIAAFVLFPGLFISVLAAIKDIFTALIGGSFSFTALAPQLILAGGVLLITAIMGRFICGFLCSFGATEDLFWFIGRKLKLPKLKISEKTDRRLKLVKYVLLLGIVNFVWTGGIAVDSLWNPWTVFGMYASVQGWPSAAYLVSIGGALLLLILIGSLFAERFFCRYLCPLGAVFAIVSRVRLFRIKKPRKECGACRACTVKCSMGIPLYQSDTVTSGECIDCFQCKEVCPRDNISANPVPAVATVIAVGALTGMYYLGNLASDVFQTTESSGTVVTEEQSSETGQYIDGVYTGSAQGFRGDTEVSVTVENGWITEIKILSYEDDNEFFSKAKGTILSEVIAAQSVDVDTVSGATFSSEGILDAVADALSSAGGDTLTDTDSSVSTSVAAGTLDVADGVYSGSGTGYRGTTTVSVTVSDGTITDIAIDSYSDDEAYFSRAEDTILSEIIDAQSVDVDTVSGATFSSNGILEAVADALNLDFTNSNSSAQDGSQNRNGQH